MNIKKDITNILVFDQFVMQLKNLVLNIAIIKLKFVLFFYFFQKRNKTKAKDFLLSENRIFLVTKTLEKSMIYNIDKDKQNAINKNTCLENSRCKH